jgi:hypothetical protein
MKKMKTPTRMFFTRSNNPYNPIFFLPIQKSKMYTFVGLYLQLFYYLCVFLGLTELSKSNKKPLDGRGISDYLFRNLQWFIIINSLLKKVQYMNILQRNCTKDNSHKINHLSLRKWCCTRLLHTFLLHPLFSPFHFHFQTFVTWLLENYDYRNVSWEMICIYDLSLSKMRGGRM